MSENKGSPLVPPTRENIEDGMVVLIDGYQIGMTVIAMAKRLADRKAFKHFSPLSASYYNNAYRWALRHLSLIPTWLGNRKNKYQDTHKVWRARFNYMEEFVPEWMRKLLPFIEEKDWQREEREFERYRYYAEPAFGQHYRYPPKDSDTESESDSGDADKNPSSSKPPG